MVGFAREKNKILKRREEVSMRAHSNVGLVQKHFLFERIENEEAEAEEEEVKGLFRECRCRWQAHILFRFSVN